MGYSYQGFVNLKRLYVSMKKIGVSVGTFDHIYNNIQSSVIFDTRSNWGWKLIFIKKGIGTVLEIPVVKGYKFSIVGDETYQEFRSYFEISGEKGIFSIKEFIQNLNKQIPQKYVLTDKARKVIIRYDKIDKDSEGIYPIGIVNWYAVHVNNPDLPDDKFHRTAENLAKTKELYPQIYMKIKDLDISIRYGENEGQRTKELREGENNGIN